MNLDSVIHNEVIGNRIWDRLVEMGVIAPAKMYSEKRGKYLLVQNVFDCSKCGDALKEQIEKDLINTKPQCTKEELHNAMLFPVYQRNDDPDIVCWKSFWQSNDIPSIGIGRLFPNEVFSYKSADFHYFFKGDEVIKNV